jgi:hypothetical protein
VKKRWILIAMLLLSACGGGGGGNGAVSSNDGGGGTSPVASVDIIVTRTAHEPAMTASMAAPAPTSARISITNPNVNGLSYKQIQDISIPGSTQLTIPIASGYTFELLTYVPGTVNYIEEYAVTPGVSIVSGNNTVTLNLNQITVGLNIPASLTTGQSYTVLATYLSPGPSPLQSGWYLKAQTSDYSQPLHMSGVICSTSQITLVAPVNNNLPGTMYFQGEFFIKSSMLNATETYTKWAFVYPNPSWGDSSVSAPLLVPSGTVTITLP